MSTFSSLFQSGTAFYGDPFGPIIDTIQDFGWSLLPQFPGSIRPSTSSGSAPPRSYGVPEPVPVLPPIPVGSQDGWGIEASPVHPVFTRSEPARPVEVPRTVVVVEDVATEVEQYEQGDFPAGSIFAPGRAWGVEPHDLDTAPNQEPPVSVWTDIFTGVVDTLQGQPWGGVQQQQFNAMGPAFVASSTQIPSGAAALPPGAAPVLSNGAADCGNRRYVTLDRQTGKITCKRRRRRRLLTNRDLADLASLKTITGGGAALNAAVIRAVR